MSECLLSLKEITKSFGAVRALDSVNFDVMSGEVHVLMGENGAGKSTLMKIIDGIYRLDEGEIALNGEKITISSPHEAQEYGIAMIHQELNNILEMTVAENIFLGREPKRMGLLDKKKMNQDAQKALKPINLNIDPSTKMKNLSIAQMQMIEIAKAISMKARILIMDEPTSAISEKEIDTLFEIIRLMRKKGVGIIYISHKMDEVFKIADRITVLRDGKSVITCPANELDRNRLITLMVGREITNVFPPVIPHDVGDVILEVEELSCEPHLRPISFHLHAGEVLGVGGLMGSGRSELLETIFGVRSKTSGVIRVCGREVDVYAPTEAISCGMAYVTEDRRQTGLNLKTTILKDTSIVTLDKYCIYNQIIEMDKERKAVEEISNTLDLKAPSITSMVSNLSGGNQQKVVLARWLLSDPQIILLDEPTRGIDVGAKYEIHIIIQKLAASGCAVLMVSSEMPEIIGVCDRVIVLQEGQLMGDLQRQEMTQEAIMNLASGKKDLSHE